jgi:hypothetical protein
MSERSDPSGTPTSTALEGLPASLQPVGQSELRETWARYSPNHAPHVVGVYSVRRYGKESGMPLEQTWKAACLKCGASHRGRCSTGGVKAHIARFGGVHAGCGRDVMGQRRG